MKLFRFKYIKMFGKGNFDGQFRTTPNVSIRGATKSESKEQLLKRAHEERLQREVYFLECLLLESFVIMLKGST